MRFLVILAAAVVVVTTAGAAPSVPRSGADESPYPCEVCLVATAIEGGGTRIVLREPPGILELSPDRTKFLFTNYPSDSASAQEGLYLVSIVGGGPERRLGPAGVRPAFSPDGTMVAYSRAFAVPPDPPPPCFGEEIWIAQTEGGGARQFPKCGFQPAWSPDSRRLSYIRDLGYGSGVLAQADIDGGDARDLGIVETTLGYSFFPARWSAGGLIAYTTPSEAQPPNGGGSSSGGPLKVGSMSVHVVRPDGTKVATLAHSTVPSWSPDGRRLAYVTQRGSADVLRVSAPDGSHGRDVLPNWCCFGVSGPAGARWSPNGRLLAFAIADQLFVVRPAGGRPRQVTRTLPGGSIDALWWSPDGSRLYYIWEFTQEH